MTDTLHISPDDPRAPKTTEDPLESIAHALAFASKDWALDRRDAWIYGIVLGWDDALDEVAIQHRWAPSEVERLKRLHAAFEKLREVQP